MATARCDLKPRPGPRPRVETAQGELRPQQAGPGSEQPRTDTLLDSVWLGAQAGWARHRAHVPGAVVTWKGSHSDALDTCPSLVVQVALPGPPSALLPHRTWDPALALGSAWAWRPRCYAGFLPGGGEGTAHVCASWALARASSGAFDPEPGAFHKPLKARWAAA